MKTMEKNQNDQNNPKKPLKKWAMLSGIGFQMGATIFVCAWIGKKLDAYFVTEKNWFTIGLILFGVFGSLLILMKELKYLNKDDK